MKKLIAIAALGVLVSMAPVAFAGEQEGPVFEPRPVPPYSTQPAQGTQILSPGDAGWEPLNLDVRG